jgi:hypothetical protein
MVLQKTDFGMRVDIPLLRVVDIHLRLLEVPLLVLDTRQALEAFLAYHIDPEGSLDHILFCCHIPFFSYCPSGKMQ